MALIISRKRILYNGCRQEYILYSSHLFVYLLATLLSHFENNCTSATATAWEGSGSQGFRHSRLRVWITSPDKLPRPAEVLIEGMGNIECGRGGRWWFAVIDSRPNFSDRQGLQLVFLNFLQAFLEEGHLGPPKNKGWKSQDACPGDGWTTLFFSLLSRQ